MDILSSQANLAGYKAVIEASSILKSFTYDDDCSRNDYTSKMFNTWCWCSRTQAIATAKRLGCVVSAFDVRPEVEEQVNSLGAKFVKVKMNKY